MDGSEHIEHIERFVKAKLASGGEFGEPAGTPRVRPFVTISRQSGAGGQALAEMLVEYFASLDDTELFGDWQVFDQRLCEIVAEDARLGDSLESLLSEEYRGRAEEFFRQLLSPSSDQGILMDRVFRTIRMLVGLGKVIIVGRGGSEVTRGMEPGFSLRLVAPEDVRIKRLMERHQIDAREARSQARRRDANRARLLRRYFGVDIDDPTIYDAMFNTGQVSLETIAESVAAGLRRRVAVSHS